MPLRNDIDFMRLALEAARGAEEAGEVPVGAVLVQGDAVLAVSANRPIAGHDPTAHAEIVAIRDACQGLGTFRLDDCELFTSCEPCPMCLGAIYWARLRKIYFGALRSDAAEAGFIDDLIYKEIALPPFQRELACEQLMADQAVLALAEWKAKADKILY